MQPSIATQLESFLRLTTHHRGEAADAYDDAADGYDLFAAVWDRTVAASALRRFDELLVQHTPPGADVLDVAAGTGRRTRRILDLTDPRRVVALDGSQGMLDVARRSVADPRVEFVQGDACELPFPDASFDVVCSTWLLSILHDPRAAVREFLRVLKPGGTALYAYCTRPDGEVGAAAEWLASIRPDINPLTHMVTHDEEPVHHCPVASVERFALGFTSVVALGSCCTVDPIHVPAAR